MIFQSLQAIVLIILPRFFPLWKTITKSLGKNLKKCELNSIPQECLELSETADFVYNFV